MTDELTQVTKIINKYCNHKDSFISAQQWLLACKDNDPRYLRNLYKDESLRMRQMVDEILKVLRPDYNSPLYKAMQEDD